MLLPPAVSTHLYTSVERGTVSVKCLAQEHSTMSPTRARTRTARSEDERTNHEGTASPTAPTLIDIAIVTDGQTLPILAHIAFFQFVWVALAKPAPFSILVSFWVISHWRTFALIVSGHPYCARKFTCHVMHRARALSTKMNNAETYHICNYLQIVQKWKKKFNVGS